MTDLRGCRIFGLVVVFGILSLCKTPFILAGPAKDPTEGKIEALWKHKFEMKISKIEAMPGTYLAVTSAPRKKKSPEKPKLWLFDGIGGNVVWSGLEKGASLIAGDPHPILVLQGDETLTLTALDRGGGTVWTRTRNTAGLSLAVDFERNELLILEVKKLWWTGSAVQNGGLTVLSLTDGEPVWNVDIGALRLPTVVPPNVMNITSGSVWIAVGGRVLRVSRDSRDVAFNQSLDATLGKDSSPVLKWDATDGSAAILSGRTVHYLDAKDGLKWSKDLDVKKSAPESVALTEKSLISGFRILKKERTKLLIVAYDRDSGTENWRFAGRDGMMAKWDRASYPPAGMAVGSDRVVVAIKNKLIGLDEGTGLPAYTVKLKKKIYTYAKRVERWQDRVILFGKLHNRAHDLKTGELLWKSDDFGGPKDYAQRNQKLSSAMMSIGFQAAAGMQEFSAQSMKSLANSKLPGRIGKKYTDYVFSPSSRQQMLSAAYGAERSSAWYKVGQSISFVGLSNWIDLVNFVNDPGLHVQPRIIDTNMWALMPFRKASVAVVDLKDGTYRESMSFRAQSSCMTALVVDVPGRRIYYANHKLAPACTKYKGLSAYELPEDLLR